MRVDRLAVAFRLGFRELLRRRIVLLLLLLIPSIFYLVVVLTTTEAEVVFRLASIEQATFVLVAQRHVGAVFMGLASVGVLTAFLGLNLAQREAGVCRRLVLCGYRPWELVISRTAVLVCVIAAVAAYVASVLPFIFPTERFGVLVLGFFLGGWVYGCYGLLVGVVLRRELEGVLFVVLLANLDVGWLQNPIYYAFAQNQAIIRSLPAYFPSQVSVAAAFTDHAVLRPVLGALAYGATFLLAAVTLHGWRMRTRAATRGLSRSGSTGRAARS